MTTTDRPSNSTTAQAAEVLLRRAMEAGTELGEEVRDAVTRAAQHRLPEEDARRLYRRVLGIVRAEDSADLDEESRRRLAAEIDSEVANLLLSRSTTHSGEPTNGHNISDVGPTDTTPSMRERRDRVVQVSRMGMRPHDVVPTPVFNGLPVPMTEGYVDVETIPLWQDNARVVLYVEEFRERNGRAPEPAELLSIMAGDGDPFELRALAGSIARRGVERPPIIDCDGVLHDGNRRVAAAQLVLQDSFYDHTAKERARWVKVWKVYPDVTREELDAVVVALNFEDDHKVKWPEYVKARLVADAYDSAMLSRGRRSELTVRQDVATQFALTATEVKRYVQMMRWATEFEEYHIDEGKAPGAVRHKSNEVFQWFYELDAGRGQEKLRNRIDNDEDLQGVVYDLMYDVMDSGLQVRNLHKIVAQEDAMALLRKAHESHQTGADGEALDLVKDAVGEALRRNPSRRGLGFEQFVEKVVDRFGASSANDWERLTRATRRGLRRVMVPALAALEELESTETDEPADDATGSR
jgi:uncharacterized protein (DUF2267 family)